MCIRDRYWIASRQHLDRSFNNKQHLLLVSRPASPSPAVGYYSKHNAQQKALIESALGEIEQYKYWLLYTSRCV